MSLVDGKIEERAGCRNYLKIGAIPERRCGQYETDRAERPASTGTERATFALLRRLATRTGGSGSTTIQQGILTGVHLINAVALTNKSHFPPFLLSIDSEHGKCSEFDNEIMVCFCHLFRNEQRLDNTNATLHQFYDVDIAVCSY